MNEQVSSRLAMIMETLNISGKELAAALHVDHSLISKWRNNKRLLVPHSIHSRRLAEVLLEIESAKQYNVLASILRAHNPEIDLSAPGAAAEALRQWLTDRTPAQQRPLHHAALPGDQVWYDAQFRVWSDNAGRRQAVLDFLHSILAKTEPQELWLLSQEDMQWMLEDPAFVEAWKETLAAVLKAGHRLEIIHWVDRDLPSLQSVLESWLPLHLTGGITSWFYPEYVNLSYRLTLFLHCGHAVLVGMQPDQQVHLRHTALFSDPISLQQYEAVFRRLRGECRRLVEIQPISAAPAVVNGIAAHRSYPCPTYFSAPLPPALAMPAPLIADIFTGNGVPADTVERCGSYLESAISNVRRSRMRCVVSHNRLRSAMAEERVYSRELSILTGQDIYLTGQQFRRQLTELMDLLSDNHWLELAVVEPTVGSGNVNLWIEQNNAVAAWSEQAALPYTAVTKEPTMVSAFFQHYDMMWNSIPRIQRQPEAIRRLLAALVDAR